MFGYYNQQQQYGPMNALADILGAYMHKKNTEGAMNYASDPANFITDPNQQQQQSIEQQPSFLQAAQNYGKTGNTIDTAINQNATPNFQITGNTSGGLNGSILNAAQNYGKTSIDNVAQPAGNIAINNAFDQQRQDYDQQQAAAQKAAQQKQYDDFAAAKAANPEWYVGNTYVGNDQKARQAALQQQQIKQFNDSNQAFQDRRKSFNDFSSQIPTMKANALKYVIKKYGAEAAKQVEPMIDSAIKSRLSSMSDDIDEQNRQWLMPFLTSSNINTPQGMRQALWATTEYNNMSKRMGLSGMDTAMLGKMLSAGDVAITSKDLGNGVQFYAVPKNGGTFDDGSYIKPILGAKKGLSPDTEANLNERHFEHVTPSGNAELSSATQLKTTKMNIDGANYRAGLAASRGNSQQLQAARALVSQHQAGMNAARWAKDSDDPNWGQVQQANKIIANAAGINSDNSSSSDPMGQWINQKISEGYTQQQIINHFHSKGIYRYDSWVPNTGG